MLATVTQALGPHVNPAELLAVLLGAFAALGCLANALLG